MPQLTCPNTAQLAELVSTAVPILWKSANTSSYLLTSEQHSILTMFCFNVLRATQISNSCVLLALYYLKQYRATFAGIQIQNGYEAELFTAALMIANKCLDDSAYSNHTWSTVSKIPVRRLNELERDILIALDYSINPSPYQFYTWTKQC
ncbi:cyclin-domain-containing protein, partial [Spinellus fusiger]